MKTYQESHRGIWVFIVVLFVLLFALVVGIASGAVYTGFQLLDASSAISNNDAQIQYIRENNFYESGRFCEVNDESRINNGKIAYTAESGDFSLEFPKELRIVKERDVYRGGYEGDDMDAFTSLGDETYGFIAREAFLQMDCTIWYNDTSQASVSYVVALAFYPNGKEVFLNEYYSDWPSYDLEEITKLDSGLLLKAIPKKEAFPDNYDYYHYLLETEKGVFLFNSFYSEDDKVVKEIIESIELM